MRILFNDIMQNSDLNEKLKSPALFEFEDINGIITINFDKPEKINCIGIGNTDGTIFNIEFNDYDFIDKPINFNGNGLYCFDNFTTSKINIYTNAKYIGRIAAGVACKILTSVAKEPAFNSTSEPRITLSGQVISGLGGYNYRTLSLDSRYKINEAIMNEIKNGYKYIGQGYPFFIDLSDEQYKLPFNKLYATEKNQRQMSFEGGIRKYLYSRRWNFEERF
jgi:hypothetical protein